MLRKLYHSKWKRLLILPLILVAIFLIMDYFYPFSIAKQPLSYATTVLAKDGSPLRAFPSKQGIWRYPIKIEQVSPYYIQALLTYEDRWFYYHIGVNPFSVIRAMLQYIWYGRVVSGASTITMQVARLLEPHPKTLKGKLWQVFRALQLEYYYSKQQILTLYLNLAPFGGIVEGVQAASYTYLGKSAKELSHAEAALLAVLPQSPSRFRPDRYPQRATQARNKVLDRLAEFKVWSKNIAKQAKQEVVLQYYQPNPLTAPLLARRLQQQYPKQAVIQTTLDINLQQRLEDYLKNYISQFPKHSSAAILVVDHQTMEVKAYLGSADFSNQQRFGYVDMITALRSPGSTLKPFLYGLAIEQGLVHSHSLLVDSPITVGNYRPENFSQTYTGAVSVAQALQHSLNIPAVKILQQLQPHYFHTRLAQAGLNLQYSQNAKPNLALILGGTATKLEDLVSLYTTFARQGLAGKLRYTQSQPIEQRYFSEAGVVWIIRQILQQSRPDLPNTTSHALRQQRQVAWKTGTSYGFRDAWAIGVSQQYVIGVWLGRPDGTPSPGYYGAVTALPLLFSIVDHLSYQQTIVNHPQPNTVTQTTICWPLGLPLKSTKTQHCHQKHQAWLFKQQQPPTLPDINDKQWQQNPINLWVDKASGRYVPNHCHFDSSQLKQQSFARWPNAIASNYPQYALPKLHPNCQSNPQMTIKQPLKIIGLNNKHTLYAPNQSKQLPTIHLQAKGGQGQRFWLLNGEIIAQGSATQILSYTFKTIGEYILTVIDETGEYDRIEFTVAESG